MVTPVRLGHTPPPTDDPATRLLGQVHRISRGRTRTATSASAAEVFGELHANWQASTPQVRMAAFDALFSWVHEPRSDACDDKGVVLHFLAQHADGRMAQLRAQLAEQPTSTHQEAHALLGRLEATYGRGAPQAPRLKSAFSLGSSPTPSVSDGADEAQSRTVRPPLGHAAALSPGRAARVQLRGPRPMDAEQALAILLGRRSGPLPQRQLQSCLRVLEQVGGREARMRAFQTLYVQLQRGAAPPDVEAHLLRWLGDHAGSHLADLASSANSWGNTEAPSQELRRLQAMARELSTFPAAPPSVLADAADLAAQIEVHLRRGAGQYPKLPSPANSLWSKQPLDHLPQINHNLAQILAHVPVTGATKQSLPEVKVTLRNGFRREVRVSTLTAVGADAPALYMAETVGAGAFSKFRPAVLPDGRVVGARMVRTERQSHAPRFKYTPDGSLTRGRVQKLTYGEVYVDERRALQAVDSPFAPLATFVDEKGRLYDVVEMADGDAGRLMRNLDEVARAKVMLPALHDLLGELVKLEAAGYVHRDIKPENVVWRRDGSFALADYGLAQPAGDATGFRGTTPFVAPEVIFDDIARPDAIDVYALGVTLIAMLNGDHLHDFPLALRSPGGDRRSPEYRERMLQNAQQIVYDHGNWVRHVRQGATMTSDAAVRKIDLVYRRMRAVSPALARLVFFNMLNPAASERPAARDLLTTLEREVGPNLYAHAAAAPSMAPVLATDAYSVMVDATLRELAQVARTHNPGAPTPVRVA